MIAVAPYMGAWIETSSGSGTDLIYQSLPIWERGLKPGYLVVVKERVWSLPIWERGLKLAMGIEQNLWFASLPIWERGLKRQDGPAPLDLHQSLPIWERGLKPNRLIWITRR